jgi:hypothetical protein
MKTLPIALKPRQALAYSITETSSTSLLFRVHGVVAAPKKNWGIKNGR